MAQVGQQSDAVEAVGRRPSWGRRALGWVRTLHIYLAMLGLGLMLFLGVTGFMLNHAEWFGLERSWTQEREVAAPAELLRAETGWELKLAEHLRAELGATGRVAAFEASEEEVRVTFRRPGQRVDVTLDRAKGTGTAEIEQYGVAGVLTDLHKGANASWGWKRCLDGAAVLLAAAAVSGVVLGLALPKRRGLGAAALAVGVGLAVAGYLAR